MNLLSISLNRRAALVGAASLLWVRSSEAQPLVLTPGQTEGPFYPVRLPTDIDADLVRVQGRSAAALGQVTHIGGRVLDRTGAPVPGATLEIWQCDSNGVYRHPNAPDQARFDEGFQGYGRAATGADGAYAFRTIRPVPYPGRAPHIHFKVHVPGRGRLTTQMYVAGEPLNARDGLLSAVRDRRARESLIVPLAPAPSLEPGALAGRFDIVVG
jgi:protocatechuate 3,4-dioxygenase, beta subunit